MAVLFTRPMYRDWIRRQLQITPPIDVSAGPIGAQPSWNPYPTNEQINDCLQNALSDINTFCGSHIIQQDVAQPAVTANGPYGFSLQNLSPNAAGTAPAISPLGIINDVQRVLFTPSGGSPILLQPTSRDILVRLQSTYYLDPPSTPAQWYVDGYVLYITPAPSVAGTFTLTCGMGFVGLQGEADIIDQLPIDFQPYVGYQAIYNLSLMSTMDAEARERAANFGPKAREGMLLIRAWKFGNEQTQAGLVPASYRLSYGTRRIRR